MNSNWEKSFASKSCFSMFVALAALMLLAAGSKQAEGQACAAQNWAASTPNIWAATVSDVVMLNNSPTTNQPTIPIMLYDGTYSPEGYSQHPQAVTQLNTNWSCPSGTPVISIAGAGRETVSFQLFITAPAATTLSDVSVTITPLTGPGATFTSDNTGTSEVTRYLEGYVPYSCTGATSIGCVQATGSIPDPLIPFYDPYDSGNPAVATPFNVQEGTTQGVWVNISIPANQTAGAYAGTLTVSGTGITTTTIPVNVTVWNGNLPGFDAGAINSSYADMLKVWLPLYESNLDSGEGISGSDIPLFQKYQVMAHNYDIDTQFDPFAPSISGAYPSTNPTSFTTNGTTSSITWTTYDSYFGPSLTPGGLFSDGTAMRVLDGPIANGGAGAWTYGAGYSWCMYNCANAPLMPAGLVSLTQNYATQTSQHFSSNHTTENWVIPDLMSYTFDENYNNHSYQLGQQPLMYQIMSQVMQAINASNSSLSSTWAASTAPMRVLTTDEPACMEDGDTTYYTASACADHLNLSYPGTSLATPGYSTSWVTTWSPSPGIYMTGQPGPGLSYGVDPTIIAGTGYQYTLDLTQGVPAESTAPAPIERWTYNNGGGGSGGVYRRVTYWAAYKYGQDETIPSVGDPNPATPAPGGLWSWIGNFWGGYNGTASASSCNSLSPFVQNGDDQGDTYIFPGNELGCYYTANPVGQTVLTANPAVNTTCTSNNYSVCNGISGPIATRELEQWRRGYEDYEYLYLYGKQAGRAAANAVVASIAAEGMANWEGYDWENIDGAWYEYGVTPVGTAYSGNCTYPTAIDSTIFGDLPNGLPNGPTGQGSSGPGLNYDACEGLWSPDPYAYESARIQLAEALGFAPATTPSVTSLSPTSGLNSGGTSVTITGTDFTGATAVEFGGVPATSFTINSSTKITAIAPAGNGIVTVQVFGPGGVSESNPNDLFTNVSPVTVTGLSPSQGVQVGGNSVSITGTYFSTGATVMFGDSPATNVVVNSATSITATAPAGNGEVNVTVTTSQGTSALNSSDLYTYEPPPTVTSVSPASGPIAGGTSVTLGGTGFVSGMTVAFGSNAGTSVNVTSSTSATVTSPEGSSMSGGAVNVTVTTVDGTSPIAPPGDQYTYVSPVTVTALSVHSGAPAGGTSVVITGTDFTGASAVKFGGDAATSFTVNSSTQITATSPAGGGTVDVTVTNGSYSSAPVYADEFSYTTAIKTGVFSTLPTTAVGSTSSSQNVSITLATASAISSITVPVAQNGVQEFKVGTVTGCTIGGGSNAANTVCTVPITFSPQYPGIRLGTLTVNNDNDVIGTAGLAGIGQGPEIAVTPGSLTMSIGGGAYGVTDVPESVTAAEIAVSNNGSALAIDGAGNLYIADDINCLAYKVTATTQQIVVVAGDFDYIGGRPSPTTTPSPALGSGTCPQAIAVDGAGNIYIGDAHAINSNGYPDVVEEVSQATGEIWVMAGGGSNAPSTTSQAATSVTLAAINSLATDSSGNLYISDFYGASGNGLIEKVTPAGQLVVIAGGGSTPISTTPEAATSAQLSGPTGMVFDASGNLYFSDQNISVIEKMTSAGQVAYFAGSGSNAPTTTPQAALSVALNNPAGLAVDGAGDLYIADFSNDLIEQVNLAGKLAIVAGGGGTVPTSTVESSLSASFGNIEGVEVDGAGNIFIADGQTLNNGANMIEKVTTVGAPLNFPYTNVGSTSVPQSLNLMNIGNESLTLSSVAATTDFPLQTTGTCTLTAHSGQSLATSANCTVEYAFDPTTGGVLDESATLTDNNLNVSNATQLLSFTGTGVGGTNVATPTFSPVAGSYGPAQTVTISSSTSGATIYYTTNGTTPTTSSTQYTAPITVSVSETVEALAVKSGYTNSAIGSAAYVINGTVATPTFSPVAGSYGPAQTVTISSATSGTTIYYTTNGTTPTTSSTQYAAPITVSVSETVEALAVKTGYTNSAIGSAAYVINGAVATPTFSPVAGSYGPAQTVTINSATSGATIYYTTNGTTPTTSSTQYTAPITVSTSETVEALAVKTGYTNSAIGSAAYVINGTVATPTFSPVAGTYSSAQTVTISSATSGTTIYYTTNGTTPTTSSTQYTAPITVSTSETVEALAVKTGYTNSAIGSAAYVINGTVATPTFSPVAGSYGPAQTVTISSATSGATIYYTTNGTTPTTSSTQYTAPITVSTSETVEALAVKSGYTNSAIGSAAYVINGTVATPTFSPVAGSYGPAQTVTISSTTSGTTIYYTTNGTTPTTSSTQYTAPITVSTSETVKALAVKTGYTNSAIGSAAYVINGTVATPTFSPVAGSYGPAQTVTISSTTSGTTIYYTTNGTTPTTSSTQYTAPITVSTSETVKALAVKTGYTNSAIGSAAYVINGTVATPTFSPVAGTYSSAQTVTISSTTSGTTIYYTTNGTTPTTSSTQYTAPITVSVSETVEALAVKTGYTNSAIGSAAYTISGTLVATPTFSPAAGTYTSAQTVTISDTSPGTLIYYTTNGTTPTTSSTAYTAPIAVSTTETVKAIAALGENLATNGDFATNPPMTPGDGTYIYDPTNVAGWTFSGPTPNASSGSYGSGVAENGSAWGFTAPPDGANQVAFLQDNSTLTQTVGNLIVNQQYTASFYLEDRPGYSANPITVTMNGVTLLSTTPGSGWTQYNEPFTATAASEALTFTTSSTGGDYDTGLSDVVITATGSNLTSAVGSAAYTINLTPDITTIAGTQGGTTSPTSGMVAHGNSIGAPEGVAVAPVLNGAGGDVYFDNTNDYGLYVIYNGGAAAAAILAADGISSPVVGDTYPINLGLDETGPWQPDGLIVDSYGNVLLADPGYNRVYMLYAGEVSGQGTNPADALLTADASAWVVGYGLHVGYLYHVADGGTVVGAAPTTIYPHDVWVDGAENVFFTDGSGNGFVEVVYNTSGTSASTILTAEGYTSLKQGSTYIVAGGLSPATYPYDDDGGSSVAYNGGTSTANTAINNPWGLYGDSAGDIIFADNSSNKIKKLSGSTAVISTIGGPPAGTQTTVGHGGDGGLATSAQMNGPIGLILDSSGDVYFADSGNSSVRMIGTNGDINTVAGTSGTSGAYSGEGGAATSAVMNTSGDPAVFLSIDASSNIYISDEGNDMIHKF
ncbi:MAG: glycoside hydrolase domain-containing protein [Terracidiphilus sp.]|jgi:hypothetical protein